ncbi:MAG: serine/threonine-protein kinase [Planctomycetota bacterium]|nr:serine/threonine-protein kinase [Planctomycetota bacterium]
MSNKPRHPIFPGYELIEKIGQGGMGAVYKARKNDVDFAIKVVLEMDSIDAYSRFEREALAAAAVDKHPNIVSIHKLELNSQPPFIVMDFVEGESLRHFIRRGEPWSLERVVEMLEPVASALDHMHGKGVIHRDLKPANILIRSYDNAPLITDFGLAKFLQLESLSQTGQATGTPNYMAPEQLEGQKASAASDLWALAVISYELLTGGERPFQGENPVILARNVLTKKPRPLPAELDLSPETQAFFQSAFRRAPAQRHKSASSFLQGLTEPSQPPSRAKYYLGIGLCALSILGGFGYLHVQQKQSAQFNESVSELSGRILKMREHLLSDSHKQRIAEIIYGAILNLILGEKWQAKPYLLELVSSIERLQLDLNKFQEGEQTRPVPKLFKKETPEAQAYQKLRQISAKTKALVTPNKIEDPALNALLYMRQEKQSMALSALDRIPETQRAQSFPLAYSYGLLSLKMKRYQAAFSSLELSRKLTPSNPTKLLTVSTLKAEAFLALERKQVPNAALCFFRLQQIEPAYKVVQEDFQEFTKDGQIDLNLLGQHCDKLCLSSDGQSEFIDYLIESIKRGIFLHSFTEKNLSSLDYYDQSIQDLSKKLLNPSKGPYHRFWFYYYRSFKVDKGRGRSESVEFYKQALSNLQDLSTDPNISDVYKALVHFQIAKLLRQREKLNSEQWPTELKDLFFSELKKARALGYPAPDLISWESFRAREDELQDPAKVKSVAADLVPVIKDAIRGLKARAKRTREGRLYEGRPVGQGQLQVPLEKLDGLLFDYYGKLARTQHCARQLKEARASLDLAFGHSAYLRCPANTLEILIELGDLKTLYELARALKGQLENSSRGSKGHEDLRKELEMTVNAIKSCRQRLGE